METEVEVDKFVQVEAEKTAGVVADVAGTSAVTVFDHGRPS